MTRILLVSPAFHGYSASIAGALERRGYEVGVCHYDRHDDPLRRTWHRATVDLPSRLGIDKGHTSVAHATTRAVAALRAVRPDLVVVVKGDVLGDEFFSALDAHAGHRVDRVLWLYDEVRRTRHTHESLARYDGIASYSAVDVSRLRSEGLACSHVPLAYDPSYDPQPRPRSLETVFIGARYPAREALLDHLAEAGVPLRAYGRDWSRHPYDRGRTLSWRRPDFPVEREVPRQEAYGVMAAAASVVNIHGDQEGFTMRTFEACGVGGVQLIDRADVADLYEPGTELAVFADADELVDLAQRAVADPAWAASLREAGRRRTLAEHTFDHRVARLEELWA